MRCLYSKTWALREAALQKITLDLPRVARENGNRNCFAAIAQILNNVGRDKVSQVFLGALNFIEVSDSLAAPPEALLCTVTLKLDSPAIVSGDTNVLAPLVTAPLTVQHSSLQKEFEGFNVVAKTTKM